MSRKIIFSQIAAMSKNRVIGVKNGLPWHIPEDLKFFRQKTSGHIIIMGRKTFESVGAKPMPGRLNVIVTRDKSYTKPGVHVFNDVKSAIDFARQEAERDSKWGDEIFICGGEEIYKQTLPWTDRIYLTIIDAEYEGDAYFPRFDLEKYSLVEKSDRKEPMNFAFCTYQRADL